MSGSGWTETSRDNSGSDRDWIGVEVEFRHNWITNFLWWDGSVDWSNTSVMRLEPVNYS
jgi:prepilin-type processing-associated H-X9-DG protein